MPTETVLESNDIETVAPARVGDTLGYARVSTHEQNPDAQSDRLIEAGAIRVFTDIVSGKRFDRPALAELIDHARPGDRLCIIRLDRLGRSLRELLETVDGLKARGIHLISLEERRYPFTNWSIFAPPKWSKFTPPLTTARARDREPGGPGEREGGGVEPEQAETFEVGRGVRAGAGENPVPAAGEGRWGCGAGLSTSSHSRSRFPGFVS